MIFPDIQTFILNIGSRYLGSVDHKNKKTTTLLSLHVCNRKKKSDKVISWISPSRKHAETLERMMYNPEPHWTERPAQPSRSGARGATQHSLTWTTRLLSNHTNLSTTLIFFCFFYISFLQRRQKLCCKHSFHE